MGLIGYQPTIQPPNAVPEWTSTPAPVWVAGVGGSIDFNDYTFDQEGDPLTYSLNDTSPALPAGVTIVGTSLVASAAVTAGTTTGIIIDCDDPESFSSIPSSQFDIVVSSIAWLGDGLAGEFGAIAQNDSHATTTYIYQRQFAPTIPTIPEPTTGSALPTSNGVNPNAADEYFVFTWNATAESAINNATYRVIFFAKGMTGGSGYGPTLTVGGTAGTPRWLVYYDYDTPSNVQDIKPWTLSTGNQAIVKRMTMQSINWVYMVGLSFSSNGFGRQRDSDDITYYRCYANGFTIHCVGPATTRSDRLTLFECFAELSTSTNDAAFCAITSPTTGSKIISCEARNLAGDMIVIDNGAACDGLIAEDNDYYYTLFTTGNGVETDLFTNGYVRGEGFLDFKTTNGITGVVNKCYGNRVWSMRSVDPVLHPDGGSGSPLRTSTTTSAKFGIDARYNVFEDLKTQPISFIDGAHLGQGYHTFAYNLIANVWGGSTVIWIPSDYTEFYLNTIVDTTDADPTFDFTRFAAPSAVLSFDAKGNCIIDAAATGFTLETSLDSNSEFNYNAFVGSGETYEKGSSGSNYTEATRANLNFGDFKYSRRRLTGPETSTISDCVPTSSTPAGFLTGVPTTIGNRTGIGVDNITFGGW